MCCTTHASAPSVCRCSAYSTSRRSALAPVRTRSIGVISCSSVRIGLILSADPSHADAAPILPPRRRYSSVSTANHIFRCSRVVRMRSTTSSGDAPACAARAPASTMKAMPPAAVSESKTVMRSTPVAGRELLLGLACRLDRPRDASRDVDRDDVEALVHERLVDLDEVADRWLGGGGQPIRLAQAVVEGVEVRHVGLALAGVLPVHVEAHELDAVALHQLRRQVASRIGDDGDALHRPLLARWARRRGPATMAVFRLSPAQGDPEVHRS